MTTTTALAIAAGGWGVAMAVAPSLQIRRMLRRRSSRDISLGYFMILLVGFALWVAYGVALGNLALIVPNGVALAVGATTIGTALWLRRH